MRKKYTAKLGLVAVIMLLTVIVLAPPVSAWEAKPSYPASIYISKIYPWDNGQGVSILLTPKGWLDGTYYNGAYKIAGYTINEYQRLAGPWPYNKRSQISLTNEIWFHCIYTNPTKNTIDMGFSEWWP